LAKSLGLQNNIIEKYAQAVRKVLDIQAQSGNSIVQSTRKGSDYRAIYSAVFNTLKEEVQKRKGVGLDNISAVDMDKIVTTSLSQLASSSQRRIVQNTSKEVAQAKTFA
jgi:predicted nucleotidyltransferase